MADSSRGKKYLVYGDYGEEYHCGDRCDYKVLAFIDADSPEEAFEKWREQDAESLHLFEPEVVVREVVGDRHEYDIEYYKRPEVVG